MCTITIFAGFVTNGEFNYLRTRGYTRPLSVLQVRSDVRKKYARARQDVLLNILTPEGWTNSVHVHAYVHVHR